ncbi:ChaN family lipoprotein [Marinobacter daepoensis]|uniref:ChaN family lipoprotein n=1 Tax=Marinobacter daepoensis TaxID=262077 RepID=UPI001FD1AD6D|nr:ChaN family lipoprotein [Marinobacter daepoensis]
MKPFFSSLLLSFTVIIGMPGCTTLQPSRMPGQEAPSSQYEAAIVDALTGQSLSVPELARQLNDADVVIVGEYHGHHASHLLQARLQQALFRQNARQILSMEQFNLDHQADVEAYLAGRTGETELIQDANAWENYAGSYRPLVEFARQNQLPVIAANAPADIVRCVGRLGKEYLTTLPANQRTTLPAQAFWGSPEYQEKFTSTLSGSHGDAPEELSGHLLNTYQAQLLRDNTMAHRILLAREESPGHQVLHTTGTFHSEQRLGTVEALKHRAPELTIAVVSPVEWPSTEPDMQLADHRHRGDYLYFIQPRPPEFRNPDRERQAMQERFSRHRNVSCE